MGEKPDQDSKTEDATEKRRDEALEEGNTPISRELSHLGFVFALIAAGAWMALGASSKMADVLAVFLDRPHEFRLDTAADVSALVATLSAEIFPLLMPLIVVLIITGILFQAVQTPPRLAWKRVAPKASRVSISAGWKRIASMMGLVEFLKGLAKIGFLGGVGAWYLLAPHETLLQVLGAPAQSLPMLIVVASIAVLIPVCIGAVALGAFDLVFSRFSWEKRIRMTRQEVQDEFKQSEGDQAQAGRRRSIARNRLRQMMISGVPKATLVVANPTHFSVALRYVRSENSVPVVVAKGQDLIALQIRTIAEQNEIPVVEDRVLARALYSSVEINHAIPKEFFAAVANVILMLRKLGNRRVMEALEG